MPPIRSHPPSTVAAQQLLQGSETTDAELGLQEQRPAGAPPVPGFDLRGVDLNLLVVLQALLEERHVTRTAHRVALSQPATSNALRRLRRLLNDPILVRNGNSMELTPRGEQIREPLRHALESLRAALEDPGPFTPARFGGILRIAATDHGMIVLLPRLQEIVAKEAPGLSLRFKAIGVLADIGLSRTDGTDLAIGTFTRRLPSALRRKALFKDDLTCLLRSGHPALSNGSDDGALDMNAFLGYPHLKVGIIPDDPGAVGAALAKVGLERIVACELPSFLAAPFIVQRTDLIVVLPCRLVHMFSHLLDLQMRRPPIDLGSFTTEMVWDSRFDGVPAHAWLRSRIIDIAGGLAASNSAVFEGVVEDGSPGHGTGPGANRRPSVTVHSKRRGYPPRRGP